MEEDGIELAKHEIDMAALQEVKVEFKQPKTYKAIHSTITILGRRKGKKSNCVYINGRNEKCCHGI